MAFDARLAVASDPGVGCELDEDPVGVDTRHPQNLNVGNLHEVCSAILPCPGAVIVWHGEPL